MPIPANAAFSAITAEPRTRRSAMIADKIRHMLLTGELKPGHRLPTEEQLGKLFQVSRTTLREAIQMLRVSGLLDVTPGRGSFVRAPDLSRAMDDLALYGACNKQDDHTINQLRLAFQRDLLIPAAKQPQTERNKLYNFLLARTATPQENAHLEEQWHLQLAELGGGEMARLMLGALLKIQQKSREARLSDEAELQRTISLQLRLTNALQDNDVELAQRILSAYLGTASTPSTPATANTQKAA